ncbi:TraB/VirB10 family protein [Paraburkholderia aspalathi]|uniref:TraB/VirB10 family protein n=1 Tax=Paraburkholderia aspalathi TaxID=1324617 RepID=UPI001B148B04|nr:TraB/VirB10 family protein [Paraburkholderia aspalathi]CAE6841935.1 hypothetical protein R20943_07154 [Paraburkholderia aspalathi]
MEMPSFIQQKRQEWEDMDPKFRYLLIGVTVIGTAFIIYQRIVHQVPTPSTTAALPAQVVPATAGSPSTPAPQQAGFNQTIGVLPTSPRNQGLEDLTTQIDSLRQQVAALQRAPGTGTPGGGSMGFVRVVNQPANAAAPAAASGADASLNNGLGKDLPASVSFDQPGSRAGKAGAGLPDGAAAPMDPPAPMPLARPMMVSDPVLKTSLEDDADHRPDLVLPMYTGVEAVMLSGINARPSGSSGGAVGSVTSAIDVGAPFVSRVKGVAIMPNSWKASDLENCFIGGSATAVLSAERAYGIADHVSCVFKNGDVYEAPMKAYALDVDGTLGLAGKVVNKQGAMLMQAALTGVAAGLGSALAPTAVPSYNTNTGSGSTQGFTYPSPSYLAGTAVGQGINHAATELSQFYLNFAKETFPVVEVTAGTRVTWILKEDIVLKRRIAKKDTDQ